MKRVVLSLYRIMVGTNGYGAITLCLKCAADWNGTTSHLERVGPSGESTRCECCRAKNDR